MNLKYSFLVLGLASTLWAGQAVFYPQDLGSEGVAINNLGWVIGYEGQKPQEGVISFEPIAWNSATKEVHNIPDLPGYTYSHVEGIHPNALEVVGIAARPEIPHDVAFHWSPETGIVNLGFLGNDNVASAYSVTTNRVVGFSGGNGQMYRPCLWEKKENTWTAIALPIETTQFSTARAISPNGKYIAGHEGGHPVVWIDKGGQWERNLLPTQEYAYPYAINDKGQMTGRVNYITGNSSLFEAFYADIADGKILRLGHLAANHDHSQATAINKDGVIAGYSGTNSITEQNGFLWTKDKGMKKFDLGGQPFLQVKGINDSGKVVAQLPQPSKEELLGYSAVKMFVR